MFFFGGGKTRIKCCQNLLGFEPLFLDLWKYLVNALGIPGLKFSQYFATAGRLSLMTGRWPGAEGLGWGAWIEPSTVRRESNMKGDNPGYVRSILGMKRHRIGAAAAEVRCDTGTTYGSKKKRHFFVCSFCLFRKLMTDGQSLVTNSWNVILYWSS